jgi:hypothetical protein
MPRRHPSVVRLAILQPIQLRRVFPQHSFARFRRYTHETMIDSFLGAWPGRIGEREIRRPEDMIGADIIGKGRDWLVPGVEEALTLKHLQRRKIITLTGQTIMFELAVGPF